MGGDLSPPPPHPPRPPPPEPFPRVMAEVPGHVDQSHDLHLLSDRLLALRAQGMKVDVQIADQDGVSTAGAIRYLFRCTSMLSGPRVGCNTLWHKIGMRPSSNAEK
jgi:hypothetical protein